MKLDPAYHLHSHWEVDFEVHSVLKDSGRIFWNQNGQALSPSLFSTDLSDVNNRTDEIHDRNLPEKAGGLIDSALWNLDKIASSFEVRGVR